MIMILVAALLGISQPEPKAAVLDMRVARIDAYGPSAAVAWVEIRNPSSTRVDILG
jgi:hypothetical protein